MSEGTIESQVAAQLQAANDGQGNNVQPEVQPQPPAENGNGQAPYADYLSKFPEAVRPIAEPVFKEWDQNVQQRFGKIHDEYKWAEPLKPFAQSPEFLQAAVQFAVELQQDPQAKVRELAQAIGYQLPNPNQPPGNNVDPGQPQEDEWDDPRLKAMWDRLQKVDPVLDAVQNFISAQTQQQQDKILDEALTQGYNAAKQKYGDFDPKLVEPFVLASVARGDTVEGALDKYFGAIQQQVQSRLQGAKTHQAPPILSSGGGLPTNQIDPKKMTDRDLQTLTQQILSAHNSQG